MEKFAQGTQEVPSDVTYRFKTLGLTVYACGWAGAGETSAMRLGISTFEPMIFGEVVTCAKWADDGIFWAPTKLDRMAKRMATVALFNERK